MMINYKKKKATLLIAGLLLGQYSYAQVNDFGVDVQNGFEAPAKVDFIKENGKIKAVVAQAEPNPRDLVNAVPKGGDPGVSIEKRKEIKDERKESAPGLSASNPVKVSKKNSVVVTDDRFVKPAEIKEAGSGVEQKGSVTRVKPNGSPVVPVSNPDRTREAAKNIKPEFKTIEEMIQDAPEFDMATEGEFTSKGVVTLRGNVQEITSEPSKRITADRISSESLLNTRQGVTEIISISRGQLNRFVVPFENVAVVTASDATTKVAGRIVYLTTNEETPFGVFFTEKGTDRAISLTLVPSDIPQKDIYLSYERPTNLPPVMRMPDAQSSARSDGEEIGNYIASIKDVMRDMAKSAVPSGYTMVTTRGFNYKCVMPGLDLTLGQVLEGSNQKIAVFLVRNSTGVEQKIDEQWCYRKGVTAVAAYPLTTLSPGEKTELFVMMKDVLPATDSSTRPSLLGSK